jgi:hypothetical protein
MNAKYLVYVCYDVGSVFESQVLSLLKGINEANIFDKVYLILGINDVGQKKVLNKKICPTIETLYIRSFPNYPVFNYRNQNGLKTALRKLNMNMNKILFHTRGELTAMHLSRVLGKKYFKRILVDVRGTSVEEITEFADTNLISKALKISNYKKALKNLTNFSYISVVSDSLKEYLNFSYKIDNKKIWVTPGLAGKHFGFNENERSKLRSKLDLNNDDKVIVFSSGGTANWQNNDAILKLAEKGLKVLNLSKKEISHKNVINKFVSYDEMPLLLNAADVAIIWREKSLVNKVASPVKFSEYVCAGLPVIANSSVNMIADYINKHHCGILVDDLSSVDMKIANELSSKSRNNISKEGINNFGIEKIVEKYLEIYSSMDN